MEQTEQLARLDALQKKLYAYACAKKDTAQLCGVFFVYGALLWEWRARQQCGTACGPVEKITVPVCQRIC